VTDPQKSEVTFQIDDGDIKLSGFIDRFTVNQLIGGINISKINDEHLTLDLADVKKVDTAGLAWLLKVMAQAGQSGQTVQLNAIPSQLLDLAQISGVEQLLVSG
jgi:phospholipid transport system transporter-binding protein